MRRAADLAFARAMLPLVSRTFAPAIERLPADLQGPVRLAYLLFRVADTIEDVPGLPGPVRAEQLVQFASLLSMPPGSAEEVGRAASALSAVSAASVLPASVAGGETAEARLLDGLPALPRLLDAEPPAMQERIRRRAIETALGMARFVRLDAGTSAWTSLETCAELDAYEYYVAGTVGAMLDEIFLAARAEIAAATGPQHRHQAVLLGPGLQGTNILQDVSVDRARGWSYV
ncbi:MAG: squalene/phytoene synthase family protein, partial [Candidatus Eisenbacteria bacterium]|nr:squalene/phytoene synthase family protein [Candidatus Eisenbacteria bacterium]